MKLILTLPNKVLLEKELDKIAVDDAYGSFCLLAGSLDMTTALSEGLLTITSENVNTYIAVDCGFLVKQDACIYISIKNAFIVENLRVLQGNYLTQAVLKEEMLEVE